MEALKVRKQMTTNHTSKGSHFLHDRFPQMVSEGRPAQRGGNCDAHRLAINVMQLLALKLKEITCDRQ